MPSKRDISFTKNGDVEIEDGDFKLLSSKDTTKQHMHNRLKTNDPEWELHNGIGSNLEDVRGMPNTEETGDFCKELIESSFSYGRFLNPDALDIKTVPVKNNKMAVFITLHQPTSEPIKMDKEVEL